MERARERVSAGARATVMLRVRISGRVRAGEAASELAHRLGGLVQVDLMIISMISVIESLLQLLSLLFCYY